MTAGIGAWNQPLGGYRQSMVYPDKVEQPYHHQRVRYAVIALQRELIRLGHLTQPTAPLDGGFGPLTAKAAVSFQRSRGLTADGWIGRKTARHLFHPIIDAAEVERGIPDHLLYGQASLESVLDPGAEGRVDDRDRGLFQFNRYWWPSVSDQLAFSDVAYCTTLSANSMHVAFRRYGRWDCAVASHNNPVKAMEWSRSGAAPDAQIADYVRLVYEAAALPL